MTAQRTIARRFGWLLAAAGLGFAAGAGADLRLSVFGEHELDYATATGGGQPNMPDFPFRDWVGISALNTPLDTGLWLGPWDSDHGLPGKESFGLWAYANETGRVRTLARTGTRNLYSSSGRTRLLWSGTFARDTAVNPSFTLNPSWLEVRAQHPPVGDLFSAMSARMMDNSWLLKQNGEQETFIPPRFPPFASMEMGILVLRDGDVLSIDNPFPNEGAEIFWHYSYMRGTLASGTLDLEKSNFIGAFDTNLPEEEVFASHPVAQTDQLYWITESFCYNKRQMRICENLKRGLHYEIGPYTGVIDLDRIGIKPGEVYRIVYFLDVEAGEDQMESFAEAFLADPLDSGPGGFTLTTDHSPVERSSQVCATAPDSERYSLLSDGTVTDTLSGLMWQRCPLGTTLDDQGTTDPDDDLCTAGATTLFSWQAALQAADAESFAGHDDWRLPNVKELESLVLPDCIYPAVDRLAFPDAAAPPFWSATPVREDPVAWRVDLNRGEVGFVNTATPSPVRLVRDSGSAPIAPRPLLSLRPAEVDEPIQGATALLSFPVRLSRALGETVSLDYRVVPLTAAEGVDYTAASGTLNLPAGTLASAIEVVVQGDNAAEPAETLRLEITAVSANARLGQAALLGAIHDSSPVIRATLAEFEQPEGDSGTGQLRIDLKLDRPAVEAVNLDYVSEDESAVDGSDYTGVSGTLTIAAGADSASLSIGLLGDGVHENDETFGVRFSNPVGGAHLVTERVRARILDDDGPGTLTGLNDTGIDRCASDVTTGLACPLAGFPMQDGDTGRDVTANDPNDGERGFSFTASGNCVQDNVTGLAWESKSSSSVDFRYWLNNYSWYNGSGVNDGGDPGVADSGVCNATGECDTEQYVAAVNALALCGYTDWRLPTVDELFSLAYLSYTSSINLHGFEQLYFPFGGTRVDGAVYWTANPDASDPTQAWMLFASPFGFEAHTGPKSGAADLMLVRGGARLPPP